MNKKLLFGTVSLGLLLVLSACGTSTTSNNTPAPGANNNGPEGAGSARGVGHRPDYGQPATQPEIRGLVKSVVGNEVIVLKIDRPQGGGQGVASSTEATRTPTLSLNGTGSGGRQGGFAGGGGRQGGGQGGFGGSGNSTTDRTAMLEKLKAMSTGEDTVIIPVGIKMLKADPSSTGKQRTMIEATISDVTADKMLTIWLDSSVTDKKVASFVMIN